MARTAKYEPENSKILLMTYEEFYPRGEEFKKYLANLAEPCQSPETIRELTSEGRTISNEDKLELTEAELAHQRFLDIWTAFESAQKALVKEANAQVEKLKPDLPLLLITHPPATKVLRKKLVSEINKIIGVSDYSLVIKDPQSEQYVKCHLILSGAGKRTIKIRESTVRQGYTDRIIYSFADIEYDVVKSSQLQYPSSFPER